MKCPSFTINATAFLLLSLFAAPAFAVEDQTTAPTVLDKGAQQDTAQPETPVEFNTNYMKGYVSDFTGILSSPARWDSSDWLTATLVTGAAVGLYDNDAKIQKWVLGHKTSTTSDIGDKTTLIGFGALTIPVVGGMYLYGYLADDGKMRKTSLLTVESFILTGVFVQTLKYGAGRHRPYTNDPPHTWDGPRSNGSDSTMSFPSGHASSAFAIATVIASEYDNIAVQVFSYGIAGITALNRVAHNAHWSSDVFVGSAIGYFTGKAVVASHQGPRESNLSLAPTIIGNDVGMSLTYKF